MKTDPPSDLHGRLRQATKRPHRLLDHHPVLTPLIRSDLIVAQYGNALEALHGVQIQVEAGILTFLERKPNLFDYESRRKLPALESDLAALGRVPIRITTHFPAPETIGALVGVLYTIEGSTQGGRVIARLLRELPIANLPVEFFSGYGELSGQRWDDFLQFADTHCPDEERDVAVATAVATFGGIKRHLDAYPLEILDCGR